MSSSSSTPTKSNADDFYRKGIEHIKQYQYNDAIQCLKKSQHIYKELNIIEMEGHCNLYIGTAYKSLGEYDKAISFYEPALEIARDIKDRQGEGTYLSNLGSAYDSLGEYDKAISFYEPALEIARDIKDREGEGTYLSNLGFAYRRLGEYDKAISFYEPALEIARDIKHREGEGACLSNLGLAYRSLGEYDKAISFFEPALEIARDIKNRQGEGACLSNLGLAYQSLGEYDKAISFYESALEIARDIKDREGEGACLSNLGSAYDSLGEYDKAISFYEPALEIARDIKDRQGEGTYLSNLGLAYGRLGEYDKAISYYEDSIAVTELIWGDLREDGHRVTFDDTNNTAYTNLEILLFENKHDYEHALQVCEQSRSRSLNLLLREQQQQLTTISDSHQHDPLPLLKEKTNTQEPPVVNMEQMRKIAIKNESSIIVYSSHVEGSVLYIWMIGSKADSKLVAKRVDLKNQDNENAESLESLVKSTRDSIGVRSLHMSSSEPVGGLHEQDKQMDDNHSEEDFVLEDEMKQFEINNTDINLRDRARERPRPGADESSRLQKLHQLLITPIKEELDHNGESHLIIVPDKDLFLLPFAALLDKDNGKYLIEQYTLSVVPSLRTLLQVEEQSGIHEQKTGKKTNTADKIKISTLLVGNPTSDLRHANKEVRTIKSFIQNVSCIMAEPMMYLQSEATKQVVTQGMEKANIIHFACHGSNDSIFLSGDKKTEGVLTMGEVQRLKLDNAKLVVLSACDTFRGDLRVDGVIGISRAFLAAGSPTLLASRWKVRDSTTKDLMEMLYEKMMDKLNELGDADVIMLDISKLLQEVMVGMIKSKKMYEVIDWAPFVLYGSHLVKFTL